MKDPFLNWTPSQFPKFEPIRPVLPNTDFSSMVRHKRDQEVVDLGFAHIMFERLVAQIRDFEQTLKPDEEVGAYLSSFGTRILILIDNVGYQNPYFIVFHGVNVEDQQRVRLVQHTSQISVLFTVMKVEEKRKPRRIGFFVESGEDDKRNAEANIASEATSEPAPSAGPEAPCG